MAVRWHGFRLTRRKNGLRNRRRLLGGVYATQKDQEPRAAAARSRPGRARMTGWSPGEHDWDLRVPLAILDLYGFASFLIWRIAIKGLSCG